MALPFNLLTDEVLRATDQIRAIDPLDRGFDAWVPDPATVNMPEVVSVLVVVVDHPQAAVQLAALRQWYGGLNPSPLPG